MPSLSMRSIIGAIIGSLRSITVLAPDQRE
jgi:hypothetical protein